MERHPVAAVESQEGLKLLQAVFMCPVLHLYEVESQEGLKPHSRQRVEGFRQRLVESQEGLKHVDVERPAVLQQPVDVESQEGLKLDTLR